MMVDDDKETLVQRKTEAVQRTTKKVNVRMLPNERAEQSLYSNFTTVNGGPGIVLVDFGFIDPQDLDILNQMVSSGEKLPDAVNVKLSSRMAVSIDAAHHLSQQLNQLLGARPSAAVAKKQGNTTDSPAPADAGARANGLDTQKNNKGSFRFPWSRKTH